MVCWGCCGRLGTMLFGSPTDGMIFILAIVVNLYTVILSIGQMATNFGSGVVSEYADMQYHMDNTSVWNQVYEMFADVEVRLNLVKFLLFLMYFRVIIFENRFLFDK